MKKVWVTGLMAALFLCGCSENSQTAVYDRERDLYVQKASMQQDENIAKVDTGKWDEMLRAMDALDTDEMCYHNAYSNYAWYNEKFGMTVSSDSLDIPQIEGEVAKEAIKLLEQANGVDLTALIEEGQKLGENESIEMVKDGLGVMLNRQGEDLNLSAVKSGITLKDQTTDAWLREICKDQLLISTVSKGKEKRFYELCSTAYAVDRNSYYDGRLPLVRYDIIADDSGKIEQVRVVIKSNETDKKDEYQLQQLSQKLEPLSRLLASLDHQEAYDEIAQGAEAIFDGSRGRTSGDKAGCSYKIQNVETARMRCQKVVEILLTF